MLIKLENTKQGMWRVDEHKNNRGYNERERERERVWTFYSSL